MFPGRPGHAPHGRDPGMFETALPWYLRWLRWNWRRIRAVAGWLFLVLVLTADLAVAGFGAYVVHERLHCTLTYSLQGGAVAGYTASPSGCAVMQPGSFAP